MEQIDIDNLRKFTFTGVSEEIRGLRPIAWRVILGTLPTLSSQWEQTLSANYQTYEDFKKELIVKPQLKA